MLAGYRAVEKANLLRVDLLHRFKGCRHNNKREWIKVVLTVSVVKFLQVSASHNPTTGASFMHVRSVNR